MSDVRRYTYTLESCGSCQAEFVLASAYDALAAENARLREALGDIVTAFGNTEYADCSSEDHFTEIRDIACNALANVVQPSGERT